MSVLILFFFTSQTRKKRNFKNSILDFLFFLEMEGARAKTVIEEWLIRSKFWSQMTTLQIQKEIFKIWIQNHFIFYGSFYFCFCFWYFLLFSLLWIQRGIYTNTFFYFHFIILFKGIYLSKLFCIVK